MARATPATAVKGAASNIVHVIRTSICTCCTSFVMRVINDGDPKELSSRAENELT